MGSRWRSSWRQRESSSFPHPRCWLGGEAAPSVVVRRPAVILGELARELENARAALGWFVERGEVERGLRLMELLWEFLRGRGLEEEARAWFARFLARPEAAEPPAR